LEPAVLTDEKDPKLLLAAPQEKNGKNDAFGPTRPKSLEFSVVKGAGRDYL
jgi:hypothetical protein